MDIKRVDREWQSWLGLIEKPINMPFSYESFLLTYSDKYHKLEDSEREDRCRNSLDYSSQRSGWGHGSSFQVRHLSGKKFQLQVTRNM